MKKYFKFYCKAVPSSTLLDTSKPMADQSYYKEFSKDENIQMDAVGMPIYLKHINGIEKEDKEDTELEVQKRAAGVTTGDRLADEGGMKPVRTTKKPTNGQAAARN